LFLCGNRNFSISFSVYGNVNSYKQKQVYESFCAIKQKVVKVPLATIIGIVALVFTVISFAKFYFVSESIAYKTYAPFMISIALLFIGTLLYYKR